MDKFFEISNLLKLLKRNRKFKYVLRNYKQFKERREMVEIDFYIYNDFIYNKVYIGGIVRMDGNF